jgi:membrane fusion protein (multidrug efflux system)
MSNTNHPLHATIFKSMSNRIPFYTLLILVASSISILYTSCTVHGETKNEASEEMSKTYPVIELTTQDTVLQLSYVADIQAQKNIEIRARVSGILEKIYVDEGQMVKKGQLLFRINDEELKVALSQANAAYESAVADARVAEVEMKRVQTLVDKKVISKTELEIAEAKLEVLSAKVAEAYAAKTTAAKRLSYVNLYAPFDGVIDRFRLREGSLLTEGALLTTISDINSMYAYFNLSEYEYLQLMQAAGDSRQLNTAQLVLVDGTLYPWEGQISIAESEIDESTGSIAFRAQFPNPEHLLKHGATGKLIIKQTLEDALLVPQKAVFEIQDKNYVYTVDANGIVQMKEFQIAKRLDMLYVVSSGLQAHDKIVYEGVHILKNGEKITPEFIRYGSAIPTSNTSEMQM